MTQYLPVDIQSLLPRSSPQTAKVPSVGEQAPEPPSGSSYSASNVGTLIAFVRHCGCPFAEKEVRLLGEVAKEKPDVQIIVVQHSDEQSTQKWWQTVKGNELLPKAKLVNDPERQIYANFGIGAMGWTGLLSKTMITSLLDRKKEGIVNTPTGEGSWRWQNSGGLAIDPQGTVKWVKVAQDAGDFCDYPKAAEALTA